MKYMVSSGICGNSQCNNGAMMREECSKEFASLDAEKISAIQINAGSQYLKNGRSLSTANQNRIQRAGQSEMLRRGRGQPGRVGGQSRMGGTALREQAEA